MSSDPRPETPWSQPFGEALHAVVIGASGGIGAAVAAHLLEDVRLASLVLAGRRDSAPVADARVLSARVELTDEASIAALAADLQHPPNLVFNAAGLLHDEQGMAPERRMQELESEALQASYAVNAAGPVLLAKHLLPLMPRDAHAVFASVSARVGSTSDNRLGGWYAYRMSKAAHNMGMRCLAIEAGRRHRKLVCVSLHPGTVDTALSAPFQGNVPAEKLFTPRQAGAKLLDVIGALSSADSGGFFAHDGTAIPY